MDCLWEQVYPLSLFKQVGSGFAIKYIDAGVGLSPFIRYYFGLSAFKPYVCLSYSYTHISRQYVTSRGDASGKGYSTNLAPTVGIAYFISRNVALNAGLNYNILNSEIPLLSFADQSSNVPTVVASKSESRSLSLNIGFQLFFGK